MQERILSTEHLERIRRKKRQRKIRAAVILCLLLMTVLIWLTGIGSTYLARIGSVLETLELQLRPGNGFPVSIAMSSDTQARPMTNALVLMDEKDVYVYSDTGSALRSFQHGYARPGLAAGNTRFCVYNQGGKELRIEGRSQNYGTLTTAHAIQFAAMAPNGNFAAVTQSDSYQAQMTVYSDTMDAMFTWYCASDHPTRAAFAPSGKQLAVGCITSGGGSLQSVLYLVDETGEIASVRRENSLILDICYRNGDQLAVAYDDAIILYDVKNDLRQTAVWQHADSLLCCDLAGQQAILAVQGDTARGSGVQLTILSPTLQVLRSVSVGDVVQQCVLQDTGAWLIGKNQVFCYTVDTQTGQDATLTPGHRPIRLIPGKKKLLLLTARRLEDITPSAEPKADTDS